MHQSISLRKCDTVGIVKTGIAWGKSRNEYVKRHKPLSVLSSNKPVSRSAEAAMLSLRSYTAALLVLVTLHLLLSRTESGACPAAAVCTFYFWKVNC